MNFVTLPNEIVKGFTGRAMKTQKLDNNMEVEYKPFACPACKSVEPAKERGQFTNLELFREHFSVEHPEQDLAKVDIQIVAVKIEMTAARLLFALLGSLRVEAFAKIRKTNDSMHQTKVWEAAWKADAFTRGKIKLHRTQYDWIHDVLGRKIVLTKEQKESGMEPQAFGMAVYADNEYSITQALTVLSDRKQEAVDEDEKEPEAVGV